MNEAEVSRYITDNFAGVDTEVASDNIFFFYNPDPDVPPDHQFPFVTLMTNDINDRFSNLDRADAFRLNIGVSKQTFRTFFGKPKLPEYGSMGPSEADDSDYDFTVLDKLMPHPVYGRMYWVCVLNPSKETFATQVQPLLNEAYEMVVSKRKQGEARSG